MADIPIWYTHNSLRNVVPVLTAMSRLVVSCVLTVDTTRVEKIIHWIKFENYLINLLEGNLQLNLGLAMDIFLVMMVEKILNIL